LPARRASVVPVLRRGFTLLELLVVLAIVALSVGAVSLALRDGTATALEREGVRLAALLEMARAESRVTGTLVRWVPGAAQGSNAPQSGDAAGGKDHFRFIGLSALQTLPTRWLDARVTAQVLGGAVVMLGPEAIVPAQRVVLTLEDQRLELATDGLGPFAIAVAAAAAPGGGVAAR
jgi:general secretion pathway protein H